MNVNERLKTLEVLSHSVAVYIPATIGKAHIDNKSYVDSALKVLSSLFGGASAEKIDGGWISKKGKLIKEGTTKVYSFFKEEDDVAVNTVIDYAMFIKKEMNQEAVGFEVDGKFYLV